MAIYEIHGPQLTGDREAAAEALKASKTGFNCAAFVFGPFWLAVHRLWAPLAIYVVAAAAVIALAASAALAPGGIVALGLAAAVFTGLEGPNWRSAALVRRGMPLLDVIAAGSAEDAAYLHIMRNMAGTVGAPAPREFGVGPRAGRETHVLGLFPEARRT
jgi:Protein of unknown function (DUF2628)